MNVGGNGLCIAQQKSATAGGALNMALQHLKVCSMATG
jgi:hypothetical protein|tara:strand:+ start:898 stop:1011 length:114 start_codon:yes stop_codon:yes gene_type:complete